MLVLSSWDLGELLYNGLNGTSISTSAVLLKLPLLWLENERLNVIDCGVWDPYSARTMSTSIVDIWDSVVILTMPELFSASWYYQKWPSYEITWFHEYQTHTLDMGYVLQRLWSLQWSSSSFWIVEVFELYNSSMLVCSCESSLYI